MMIKRGIFGYDDYNKFGSMYDCVTKAGAVNISYSPKKSQITIMARKRDKEMVLDCLDGYNVIDVKEWHNMVWIKVKW